LKYINYVNSAINGLNILEAKDDAIRHKSLSISQELIDNRISVSDQLVEARKQLYDIHMELPDKFASALAFEQLTNPD
jgi:hypothetical protein